MIDYQIQTTASDGKFSPRECVKMAKENRLTSIAITDHDTVGGILEALEAGREFGIEVISGIELSCSYRGRMIHILGFGIDPGDDSLERVMIAARTHRENRARHMVEQLNALGFSVTYDRVKARAAGVIARPHIAAEVMENPANAAKLRAEEIQTKQDFFDKFIGDTRKVKPAPESLVPDQAIEIIHRAGGVAIWSHPTWPDSNRDYLWVKETLDNFIKNGIDGLEAFNYTAEADTHFLFELSQKKDVLRTAGSDFHDLTLNQEIGFTTTIGGYPTFGHSVEGIREALLAAIEKRRAIVASV